MIFFFLNRQYVYTVASPRAASDGCNYAPMGLERYPSVGTVLRSESEDLCRRVYGGRCICIGPVVISHYGWVERVQDRDSATEPWSWLSVVSLFVCCVSPATHVRCDACLVYISLLGSSRAAEMRGYGSEDARMKEAKMRG